MKPTYHLPPNFSTPPPPIGPFHLGTIISAFERRDQMRPINQSADKRVPIPDEQIYRDHKGKVEATRQNLRNGTLGIWAQFMGVDGIGGETSISVERSNNDIYTFDSVDTEYFYPSPTYIAQCIAIPDVKDYLTATRYKKAIYLVTGLKIAKGVSAHLENMVKTSAKAELGLNNPLLSGISVGPRLSGEVDTSNTTGFADSSDLVVGVQCLKLYHKSRWPGGEKRLNSYLLRTEAASRVEEIWVFPKQDSVDCGQ